MVTPWTGISAGMFVFLALAHSVMGEQALIRPLLATSWTIHIPRWAAQRLIRFAWHATSIAWLGLAAVVVGVEPVVVVALVGATSAAVAAGFLRGHFSWPLFLLAGLAAGIESGALGRPALTVIAAGGVLMLVAAAAVHLYWAVGGQRWYDLVLPTDGSSNREFAPGPALTLLVAGLLSVQAAVIVGSVTLADPPFLLLLIAGGGGIVLAARAVGDGKQVGFTKTNRSTPFSRADDRVFTPIVVLIAMATLCAVVVGLR